MIKDKYLKSVFQLPRFRRFEKSHEIAVELKGGLGNQLFQFGAALAQSERLGAELLVDVSKLNIPGQRKYELFRLFPEVNEVEKSWRPNQTFTESSFAFDPRIDQIQRGTLLKGYFQSWKYLNPVRSKFLSAMREHSQNKEKFGDNFIALQVRRGDYTNPEQMNFHGICSPDYYIRASKIVRNIVGNMPIVIFCDDQEVAVSFSKLIANSSPDRPLQNQPIDTLLKLSKARAHVIANSSFGWWGSWLSESSEITLAPRPWFTNKKLDTSDLLVPEWVTLDRE